MPESWRGTDPFDSKSAHKSGIGVARTSHSTKNFWDNIAAMGTTVHYFSLKAFSRRKAQSKQNKKDCSDFSSTPHTHARALPCCWTFLILRKRPGIFLFLVAFVQGSIELIRALFRFCDDVGGDQHLGLKEPLSSLMINDYRRYSPRGVLEGFKLRALKSSVTKFNSTGCSVKGIVILDLFF